MTNPTTLEERFNKEFTDWNWCACGGEYSSPDQRAKVKAFFLSELSTLRDSLEGEIKKYKQEFPEDSSPLDTALSIINKKFEEYGKT